jgi:TolB-like protein
MTAPDVFLSYNREDQPVAKRFAEAFEAAGLSVWWDVTLRSGDAYDAVTEEALRTAKAVVVLWSPRSVNSRWVRAEASIADENRTLVPVKVETCQLPVMFRLTQTADLAHWRGGHGDPAWQAFLGDVRRMVGGKAPNAPMEAPTAPPSAGGVPLVAVLPITHRSGEELELLAEDLTEDLVRELAQNSLVRVIAAGSMAAFRGTVLDHRSMGRELDARYLIEARLQRAGDSLRLALQVIEAATGAMLYATRIARTLDEIDLAPEELAVAAACELGEQITRSETARALSSQASLTGWDHVLRAMAYFENLGPEGERRAYEEARKATEAAPDLGLAYALLAQWFGNGAAIRLEEIDDAGRRAMHVYIKRAMQLDGSNPVILNCVSAAYAYLGDYEACMRLARRAVAQSPNSPIAHFSLGHASFAQGRTKDAIAAFTDQIRLAPRDMNRATALMLLGVSLYAEGRQGEAEDALNESLSLHPDYHVTLAWKAVVAACRGDIRAARETVVQMRESEPGLTIDQHLRMLVYYPNYQERFAEAAATLRNLWAETEGGA